MFSSAVLVEHWSEFSSSLLSLSHSLLAPLCAKFYAEIEKNHTVNFLNIRTPKKSVVISLKFELCRSTIE